MESAVWVFAICSAAAGLLAAAGTMVARRVRHRRTPPAFGIETEADELRRFALAVRLYGASASPGTVVLSWNQARRCAEPAAPSACTRREHCAAASLCSRPGSVAH